MGSRFSAAWSNAGHMTMKSYAKWVFRGLFLAAWAINFHWFSQTLPNLILDPASYPALAPIMAGLVGTIALEAAIIAWDTALKDDELTRNQVWAAWAGLIAAVTMSISTTFAAIVSYLGQTPDEVASAIVGFVHGNGVAYYIAFQIALAILYMFMFTDTAQAARHNSSQRSVERTMNRKAEKVVSRASNTAFDVLVSGDEDNDGMEVIGQFAGYGKARQVAQQLAKQNGLGEEDVNRVMRQLFPDMARTLQDQPPRQEQGGNSANPKGNPANLQRRPPQHRPRPQGGNLTDGEDGNHAPPPAIAQRPMLETAGLDEEEPVA